MLVPAGTTKIFFNRQEIHLALEEVSKLRKLGHALAVDEVLDAEENFIESRVTHYRTCRACLKED